MNDDEQITAIRAAGAEVARWHWEIQKAERAVMLAILYRTDRRYADGQLTIAEANYLTACNKHDELWNGASHTARMAA